ncbi:MAG: hypothetical protein R3C05_11880 [Pirellulaceae bacterium]
MLGLQLQEIHHRSDDDAWNIAYLPWRLLGDARVIKPYLQVGRILSSPSLYTSRSQK